MNGIEVYLSGETPFARGGCRVCYRDPRDSRRCLKVMLPDGGEAGERQRNRGWVRFLHRPGYYDENHREWRMSSKLARTLRNPDSEHVVRCHGFVRTDIGDALATDLVRNADGSAALNLMEYVRLNGIDESCKAALNALERFLLENRVLMRNAEATNIILKHRGDGRLIPVIVDGIGNSEFIPVSEWVGALARRKIARKWRKMMRTVERIGNSNSNVNSTKYQGKGLL